MDFGRPSGNDARVAERLDAWRKERRSLKGAKSDTVVPSKNDSADTSSETFEATISGVPLRSGGERPAELVKPSDETSVVERLDVWRKERRSLKLAADEARETMSPTKSDLQPHLQESDTPPLPQVEPLSRLAEPVDEVKTSERLDAWRKESRSLKMAVSKGAAPEASEKPPASDLPARSDVLDTAENSSDRSVHTPEDAEDATLEVDRLEAWRKERRSVKKSAKNMAGSQTVESAPENDIPSEKKSPDMPQRSVEKTSPLLLERANTAKSDEDSIVQRGRDAQTQNEGAERSSKPAEAGKALEAVAASSNAGSMKPDSTAKIEPRAPAPSKIAPAESMPNIEAETPEPRKRVDPIEEARLRLKEKDRKARRSFWRNFAFFAVLPALLAAAYEVFVAVPLYETQSVVVVSKVNGPNDSGLGGLLGSISGAGVGNINEAFMAHEYIHSQSLLNDLEEELGLVSRYSSSEMDPAMRLHPLEWLGLSQRTQFNRFVRSSVNVQTGMITLYVNAPSPEQSALIAETTLSLVEDRVNELSDELFVQQIAEAQNGVDEARGYLIDLQAQLSQLQIASGEVNPEIRIANTYESIAALEAERLEIESLISSENVSGREGSFETERLAALLAGIDARIAERRKEFVEGGSDGVERPLNELLLDYQRVQLELEIGQEMLLMALGSLDVARTRAALGRSQFQVVVPPLASNVPWRPRPLATALIVFVLAVSALSVLRLFRSR